MHTRSHSRPSSEAGDIDDLSRKVAEMEHKEARLREREELLKQQASTLQKKQERLGEIEQNLERERNAAVSIESLSSVLHKLQQNISSLSGLPQQVKEMENNFSAFKDIPAQIQRLNQQVGELFSQTEDRHSNMDTQSQQGLLRPESRQADEPSYFPPPNHTFTTHHESASPIRFKDVIDSIPKYDGHKMSVFQFSKICDRALKLIPPQQEIYLVQLIMNKLQGHAYTAIEGINFHSVSHLTSQLKKIFGPNKSLNQYRGELGNLYMQPNEDIFNYIERVKDLRTAIIDGETEIHGVLLTEEEDKVDYECTEAFINGLPSELLVRVKLEGRHSDLNSAIALTTQLVKTLEAEGRRKKSSYPIRSTLPSPRVDTPVNQPRSTQSISQPTAASSSNPPFIRPLVPGQPGPNSPSSNICRYCKTPGHHISDCRKLAYRRSLQERFSSANTSNPGNATSVPEANGVRRDANQTGRPQQILPRTVRFQEGTNRPDQPPQG